MSSSIRTRRGREPDLVSAPAVAPAKPAVSTWTIPAPPPRPGRAYDWVKSAADRFVGISLFIFFLPVVAVAAVIVRRTSRGPAIYSQIRVGRGGRTFWIYKLRTMYHNAEANGAQWCAANDPRVTPVGRWLRKLHIDELPQLWNVVRGDMSLVGPRPERPEFVVALDKAIPGYRRRLTVRPGVTGLAQIQLPADTDLESVRKKLALDLCYIDRLGASLDLRVLLGTVLYLAGVSYAGVCKALALPGARRDQAEIDTVLELG